MKPTGIFFHLSPADYPTLSNGDWGCLKIHHDNTYVSWEVGTISGRKDKVITELRKFLDELEQFDASKHIINGEH